MIYKQVGYTFTGNATSLTFTFDSDNSYKFLRLVGSGKVGAGNAAGTSVTLDGTPPTSASYQFTRFGSAGTGFNSGSSSDQNRWQYNGGRFRDTGGQVDIIIGRPKIIGNWKNAIAHIGSGDDGIEVASLEWRQTSDIDSISFAFEYGVTGAFALYGIGEN
jgi:hypothetical protein